MGYTSTVTGGTVENTGSGAAISAIGTVKLLGGTVAYTGTEPYAVIVNGSTAKLIVSSGSQINSSVNGVKLMSGTMEMTGGTVSVNSAAVSVSDGCSLTMNGGTLEGGNSGYGYGIYMTGGKAVVSSGTVSGTSATAVYVSGTGELELSEDAIISGSLFGISAVKSAAVTMLGGQVKGTGSAGVGISLQDTSTLNMQGGAVTGVTGGISVDSTATAAISGGTVTITTTDPVTLKAYAVSGPFTFSGTARLRAYSNESLFSGNIDTGGVEYYIPTTPEADGYYTFTLPITG